MLYTSKICERVAKFFSSCRVVVSIVVVVVEGSAVQCLPPHAPFWVVERPRASGKKGGAMCLLPLCNKKGPFFYFFILFSLYNNQSHSYHLEIRINTMPFLSKRQHGHTWDNVPTIDGSRWGFIGLIIGVFILVVILLSVCISCL